LHALPKPKNAGEERRASDGSLKVGNKLLEGLKPALLGGDKAATERGNGERHSFLVDGYWGKKGKKRPENLKGGGAGSCQSNGGGGKRKVVVIDRSGHLVAEAQA